MHTLMVSDIIGLIIKKTEREVDFFQMKQLLSYKGNKKCRVCRATLDLLDVMCDKCVTDICTIYV